MSVLQTDPGQLAKALEYLCTGDRVLLRWETPSGELHKTEGRIKNHDQRLPARQLTTDDRTLLLEPTVDPVGVAVAEVGSDSVEHRGSVRYLTLSHSPAKPLHITGAGVEVPVPLIGYTGQLWISKIDPDSIYPNDKDHLVTIEERGLKLYDQRLLRVIDSCLPADAPETIVSIEPRDHQFERQYVYLDQRHGSQYAEPVAEYGTAVMKALSALAETLSKLLYQEPELTKTDRQHATIELQSIQTTLGDIQPLVARVDSPTTRVQSQTLSHGNSHPTQALTIIAETISHNSILLSDTAAGDVSLPARYRQYILRGLQEVQRRLDRLDYWLSQSTDGTSDQTSDLPTNRSEINCPHASTSEQNHE